MREIRAGPKIDTFFPNNLLIAVVAISRDDGLASVGAGSFLRPGVGVKLTTWTLAFHGLLGYVRFFEALIFSGSRASCFYSYNCFLTC